MYKVGDITSHYAEAKREQRRAVRRLIWGATLALVTVSLYVELAIVWEAGFARSTQMIEQRDKYAIVFVALLGAALFVVGLFSHAVH